MGDEAGAAQVYQELGRSEEQWSALSRAESWSAFGEEAPPEYIRQALDLLKVQRIDHGVQAVRDEALMQRLARERMPLTVCPLSNQKLQVFPDLRDHPLKALLDAGLCATVNSDDPAYFGGYVNDNLRAMFAASDMDARHAWQLAANSIDASFAPPADKAAWRAQLDACFAKAAADSAA